MSGNDYQDWGPTNDPYVTAVAQGIRDIDPSRLQTVELNYNDERVTRRSGLGAADRPQRLLHLRPDLRPGAQGLQPEQFPARRSWSRRATSSSRTPARSVRLTATAEAAGVLVAPERRHRPALREPLDLAVPLLAARRRRQLRRRLEGPARHRPARRRWRTSSRCSRRGRWYDLVPDQNHTVVTSGYGTFGRTDYVTAASTPDGKLAIAYLPSGRTVTVDLRNAQRPRHRSLVRPDGRDVHERSAAARSRTPAACTLTTPGTNARRRRRLGARAGERA